MATHPLPIASKIAYKNLWLLGNYMYMYQQMYVYVTMHVHVCDPLY